MLQHWQQQIWRLFDRKDSLETPAVTPARSISLPARIHKSVKAESIGYDMVTRLRLSSSLKHFGWNFPAGLPVGVFEPLAVGVGVVT